MSRFVADPYYRQYSPLVVGIAGTFFLYLALILLATQGVSFLEAIWVAILLIPFVSLWMQLRVRRVAHIRLHQALLFELLSLSYGLLCWIIVSRGQGSIFRVFAAVMSCIMLLGLAAMGYWSNTRRFYLAASPQGPVGTLDTNTGLVDPNRSPDSVQKHEDALANKNHLVWRLAPLTAGLAMLLARGLPDLGQDVVMTLAAMTIAAGCAAAAGALLFFAFAVRRWEFENGKLILVQPEGHRQ